MKKFFLLLLLGGVIACDSDYKANTSYANNLAVYDEVVVEEVKEDFNPAKKLSYKRGDDVDTNQQVKRKLIKKGRVSFKTDSIAKTKEDVTQLVKKFKGYVSSENTNKGSYKINQHLTVRIPTEQFDAFLLELSKGVHEFDEKQITVNDVTAQFFDLQSRLKTKKELEKRYLQILTKAKNVKEILEVEKQLGILREDIEAAEGRLKHLSNQVSLSTLNISFYQEIERATEKSNKFVEAFLGGIQGIKTFSLFIISIWPFVILLFVGYFVIRRRFKRNQLYC